MLFNSHNVHAGAIAMNRLWNDNTGIAYNMYHPICSGNETNILQCRYNVTDSVPNLCRNSRYYSDETSVVCLPGKCILFIALLIINFMYYTEYSDDQIESNVCEDGQVRLSGESPYRGRVEICRGSIWGSVCNTYDCSNPSGLTTNIYSCTSNRVIGVQCVRK